MSAAPNVLTQEVLTQRQAQPMVMVQSEEILRTRTPAYSATNSDISFLVRQPSASAILKNQPELYLELEFSLTDAVDVISDFTGGQAALGDDAKYRIQAQTNGPIRGGSYKTDGQGRKTRLQVHHRLRGNDASLAAT